MKTLRPFILIIVLAGACTSIPAETLRSSIQTSTATMIVEASMTPTQVSSQTASPTISLTATPSKIPYQSPTLLPNCGTSKLGKPGTQQLDNSNAPSVLVQGIVLLCTNYSTPAPATLFDLDTGKVNTELADIEYEGPDTILTYSFASINGALSQYWSFYIKQQVIEPPQPTYDQCKQQYVDPHRMETETAYLCVITNEGHVSRVKVEKYSPILSVSWVEISFVTWSEVVVHP